MSDAAPRPVAFIEEVAAYAVPRHPAPIDLHLDGNEGRAPPASLLARLSERSPELLRRYPNARPLEARIAERLSVPAASVLVTAGADDGLDRACRAVLGPGRELILPEPTFEMIGRYTRAAGGEVRRLAWPTGPYPIDEALGAINERTAAIAIVSPNNPTGAVARLSDIERAARAAPRALVLFDHAYAEFADEDLTARALALPNVAVFRTFSKAWGLAGLRVGYVIGPPAVIGWLRRSGQPYAVAATSLALAEMRLEEGREEVSLLVARVREEREALSRELLSLGHAPLPSQANFVLCAPRDALWLRDALAGLGIGVRAWPGHPELGRYVRITCPGDAGEMDRLLGALRTASRPDALVLCSELGERVDERAALDDLARRYSIAAATCARGEAPIAEALERLHASRAWAIVRSPEEARAARSAGALPLAIAAEGDDEEAASARLLAAGAARVVRRIEDLAALLP